MAYIIKFSFSPISLITGFCLLGAVSSIAQLPSVQLGEHRSTHEHFRQYSKIQQERVLFNSLTPMAGDTLRKTHFDSTCPDLSKAEAILKRDPSDFWEILQFAFMHPEYEMSRLRFFIFEEDDRDPNNIDWMIDVFASRIWDQSVASVKSRGGDELVRILHHPDFNKLPVDTKLELVSIQIVPQPGTKELCLKLIHDGQGYGLGKTLLLLLKYGYAYQENRSIFAVYKDVGLILDSAVSSDVSESFRGKNPIMCLDLALMIEDHYGLKQPWYDELVRHAEKVYPANSERVEKYLPGEYQRLLRIAKNLQLGKK